MKASWHGQVIAESDDIVTVEIAPGVHVKFARPAIARVVKQEEAVAEDPVEDVEEDAVVEEPVLESPVSPVVETRKSKD